MAKVYSFEKFKLRRKIKLLEAELDNQNKEGRQSTSLWFNHFTVINLHREIAELKTKLSNLTDDTSFTENEKNKDI